MTIAFAIGKLIGGQVAAFVAMLIVVIAAHWLFDLSAEDAANNVITFQLLTFGWMARTFYQDVQVATA